jgi:hypothetical protein
LNLDGDAGAMSELRPSSVTRALAAYGPRPTVAQVQRAELALLAEAAQRLARQHSAIELDRIALEARSDQLDAHQNDLAMRRLHAQAGPFVAADARQLAAELAELHEAIEEHVAAWARLDACAAEVVRATEEIRQRALDLVNPASPA